MSRRPVERAIYPNYAGLYAIFLAQSASLGEFAKGGDLIYFGKAEHSLASRDFKTHFTSGKTGSSTLRRSIGAILKTDLGLKAIPRSPKRASTDLYNFKFTTDGEARLTNWMMTNLEISFFVPEGLNSTDALRSLEGTMLAFVKAPLDLDQRTKHLNLLADRLQELRAICKTEAEKS